MRGQLNLFRFNPELVIYYPTPYKLNQELWAVVRKTDNRGYSFGNFDYFGDRSKKKIPGNRSCATIVIFKTPKDPIGFCTVSLYVNGREEPRRDRKPDLDVWVMPYYRDMGFGSLLVNSANEFSKQLTGHLPKGHDKNHTACWDARFRNRQATPEWTYDRYADYDREPIEQLPLFRKKAIEKCRSNTTKHLLEVSSRTANLGSEVLKSIVETVNHIYRDFRYREP